ncbi:hypothetical protein B0H16DRAFT_1887704 [Mycena metata]|uniref:DNase I-like protein n=1 Tax=Mycena metata TaxID=1033252 RepID=A0AAD7IWN2_9AGAR|nr:hypothetical protein B0H16DRAFT_1887704 [Mycena metata]
MRNKEDKWPHLSCLMFNEHIGIMAVGETHLTEAQIEEIEDAAVGRKRLRIFNSIDPDHPNKGGVAVVLNRDITNTENIKVRRLIPGRAILVTIPWHDKLTLTVLAVYAPAGSAAENRAFWEELHRLWMTENLPVPDVMLGDMNIVEDAVDRLPHRTDDADATHALADLKRILELKDGWRMTYPDTKELTSVNICGPGAPYIGPGRYAIPLYLMNNVTFMEYAVKTGAQIFDEEESNESENIQVRFKKFKDMVGTFAKARASLTIGALEQKKLKLQKERNGLLENKPGNTSTRETPTIEVEITRDGAERPAPPPPLTPPGEESSVASSEDEDRSQNGSEGEKTRARAMEAAKLQREINIIVSRQRARKRMTTKIRYRTEMDYITKFSVRVNKDTVPRDTLSTLTRTDTIPAQSKTRSDQMAELARDYHSDLQRDESEDDLDRKDRDIETVLAEMGNPGTAPGMQDLGKELLEEDVLQALRESASGKAAGLNGIPTEFWAKLHELYMKAKKEENGGRSAVAETQQRGVRCGA